MAGKARSWFFSVSTKNEGHYLTVRIGAVFAVTFIGQRNVLQKDVSRLKLWSYLYLVKGEIILSLRPGALGTRT